MNLKSLVIIISLIAALSSMSLAFYSDNQPTSNFNNYFSENVALTLPSRGVVTSTPETFVFHNVSFTLFLVSWGSPGGELSGWGKEMNGKNYSLSISGIPSISLLTWLSPDSYFGVRWSGSKEVSLLVIKYYTESQFTYHGDLPPPNTLKVLGYSNSSLFPFFPPPGFSRHYYEEAYGGFRSNGAPLLHSGKGHQGKEELIGGLVLRKQAS